jgi:hypothetical protein
MWISPSHPNPPARPAPPDEKGERLATFPRGEDQELRVNLDQYNGHSFISLRIWEQGRDGDWWPVRAKGCSIRLSEVEGVISALCRVERMMEAEDQLGTARDRGATDDRRGQQTVKPTERGMRQAYDGEAGRSTREPGEDDDMERPRYVDRQARPPARELSSARPRWGRDGGGRGEFSTP